ncbi:MAG TPA: hypothetical protein VFN38_01015, partial [Gemmatimonadaceae bacterium]|nr:hypothetical protein [Gemmatimonadaceae bacterium]
MLFSSRPRRLALVPALCAGIIAAAATAGALAAADALGDSAVTSRATVDLTAIGTRIGAHPAYVRVVVDFTDGTLEFGEVEAIDHRAFDGSVRVRLRHHNVQAQAPPVNRAGVQAKVTGARDRLDVVLSFARHRFKYLRVSALHSPERLVLDLYRSRPPVAGAEIPVGRRGCLSLSSVKAAARGFQVR